ncbi:MAG: aldo/keto reductase [Planctomycetota bacterium]|nr:aldo/keto reductase [Planctomycetota bacterium]
MQYREVPKTGEKLSALGFGAMRMPMLKDGKTIDERRAISQIRMCIDKGVNYVDTAWPYHGGQSEPLVAKALADGYREKVNLATKLPVWLVSAREDMDSYLNQQLERLHTDQIDYYLLHALNAKSWKKMHELGVLEFLNSAIADGRIKYAGFSFHGQLPAFKQIVDAYPWIFCQIQYNYLDQQHQAGTAGLEYAAERDIAVIVMEPLRGGNLAKPSPPPPVATILKKAKMCRPPVEWALKWIWDEPDVVMLLSGMNEEEHIEQNIAIADDSPPNCLTDDERNLLDEVAAKYREIMKVPCTGCGYCLPCPHGVAIPEAFDTYNGMHLFGNETEAKMVYAMRMSGVLNSTEPSFASRCVNCGECLPKCPQDIAIPNALEDVAAELEDADLPARIEQLRKRVEG